MAEDRVAYIAGPITGCPGYREAFAAEEEWLSTRGFTVLNPAHLPSGLPYGAYMRIDAAMIRECDLIVLLEGWEDSPGVRSELELADELGTSVVAASAIHLLRQENAKSARKVKL